MLDINPNEVQDKGTFSAVIAGLYNLKIDEIEVKKNDSGKPFVEIRHSLESPDGVETVEEGGVPGGIFNRIYINNTGAINGFAIPFVKALGISVDEFQGVIGSATALNDVDKYVDEMNSFFGQFKDQVVQAKLKVITKHWNTGEELDNPRNEVAKYVPVS